MLDLNKLVGVCFDISEKRTNNGAFNENTTSSLLKHTATEVIEAMESYVYYKKADPFCRDGDEIGDTYKQFSSELADIIVCVLIIAGKETIDIEKALLDCIEKIEKGLRVLVIKND